MARSRCKRASYPHPCTGSTTAASSMCPDVMRFVDAPGMSVRRPGTRAERRRRCPPSRPALRRRPGDEQLLQLVDHEQQVAGVTDETVHRHAPSPAADRAARLGSYSRATGSGAAARSSKSAALGAITRQATAVSRRPPRVAASEINPAPLDAPPGHGLGSPPTRSADVVVTPDAHDRGRAGARRSDHSEEAVTGVEALDESGNRRRAPRSGPASPAG